MLSTWRVDCAGVAIGDNGPGYRKSSLQNFRSLRYKWCGEGTGPRFGHGAENVRKPQGDIESKLKLKKPGETKLIVRDRPISPEFRAQNIIGSDQEKEEE